MKGKRAVLGIAAAGIILIYFIRKGREVRNGNFRGK